MTNPPRSVSVVLFFICLNALVWLALGLIIAFNVHPALPVIPLLKGVMAGPSLAMAGILLGSSFFCGNAADGVLRLSRAICHYLPPADL